VKPRHGDTISTLITAWQASEKRAESCHFWIVREPSILWPASVGWRTIPRDWKHAAACATTPSPGLLPKPQQLFPFPGRGGRQAFHPAGGRAAGVAAYANRLDRERRKGFAGLSPTERQDLDALRALAKALNSFGQDLETVRTGPLLHNNRLQHRGRLLAAHLARRHGGRYANIALFERCDFDSNQSSQFGGAIYIAGNAVTAAR